MALDPTWTINGVVAATLGITNFTRSRRSQSADTVTFIVDGRNADAISLFPYGTTATIKRGNVQWFVGRVTKSPSSGSGSAQSQSCTLSGPWWYLENLTYRQQWTFASSTTAA